MSLKREFRREMMKVANRYGWFTCGAFLALVFVVSLYFPGINTEIPDLVLEFTMGGLALSLFSLGGKWSIEEGHVMRKYALLRKEKKFLPKLTSIFLTTERMRIDDVAGILKLSRESIVFFMANKPPEVLPNLKIDGEYLIKTSNANIV